ncbi:MAG: LysM peptidoglycan-binding domain-containing protein [Methanosarcinales archaeon]|jgi:LysM repeat protein|nr:LysM peptidoglycan-binding domain-containing protein [Methanosarcinales archaeon]
MYDVYFDKTLLPIPPESVTYAFPGRDEKIDLINFDQISLPRLSGLIEIDLDVRLTHRALPLFTDRFIPIRDFLSFLSNLKKSKAPFQFIIIRNTDTMDDTNITVTLSDYTIHENADNGSDITVSCRLTEYKKAVVKTATIQGTMRMVYTGANVSRYSPSSSASSAALANSADVWKTGVPKRYQIKKGDTLYNVGKTIYNNSTAWEQIVEDNGLKNRDDIKVGQWIELREYVDVRYHNQRVR